MLKDTKQMQSAKCRILGGGKGGKGIAIFKI